MSTAGITHSKTWSGIWGIGHFCRGLGIVIPMMNAYPNVYCTKVQVFDETGTWRTATNIGVYLGYPIPMILGNVDGIGGTFTLGNSYLVAITATFS